jgi:S-adenosylmethionine synthetase
VQHHNVDKALLIGGQSSPCFGGGKLLEPIRLILAGRATALPGTDTAEFAADAARGYLAATLRCPPQTFSIQSAIRAGSPNLTRVARAAPALANDTSVGVASAPYTALERVVLGAARELRSDEFRRKFPAAGDDFKVMGLRRADALELTIALAIVDREVPDAAAYGEIKRAAARHLVRRIGAGCEVRINLLDRDPPAAESDVYLTVTGLSAEHGDDGEVGRGNRVNGLITPGRAMSIEAAAGKNPIAHPGKLYSVAALELARAIAGEIRGVEEVTVRILSAIGQPVAEPELAAIELFIAARNARAAESRAGELARAHLERLAALSARLIRGELPVF